MSEADIVIRAEAAGEDVALADSLCGLDEATLRTLIERTLRRVGLTQRVAMDVLITDDAALRALNRDYRGRDEVTDVLSFPLAAAPLVVAPAEELWSAAVADAEVRAAAARRDADLDALVVDHGDPTRARGPSEDNLPTGDLVEDHSGERPPIAFLAPPELPQHLGDVVIARGAVTRQAQAAGHSPAWELAYLVVHGVLHLIGYDDQTDAGYRAMGAHQEAILQEAGLPR